MKNIAIIGGGHRAAFYLRIARMYPEKFNICCALVRNAQKAERFSATWNIPSYQDLNEMLKAHPVDFAIIAIFPEYAKEIIHALSKKDIPVLCETPPGLTVDELNDMNGLVRGGAKIQVAEQYNLVPGHAARQNAVRAGMIGDVNYAQISVAHAYHGLSLMRHFLGVGFENAKVTALSVAGKLLDGPTRYNTYIPEKEKIVDTQQTIAVFEFDGKVGVFDFIGEQYSSWIRPQHILIRGTHGEISDFSIRSLKDCKTPAITSIVRMDTAEYDYMYLHGFTIGERWIYQNPYCPALSRDTDSTYYGREWDFGSPALRITDDEIAVLDILNGMCGYVDGGAEIYSFAQGAQDQYMQLMIEEAVAAQKPVMMTTQAWAK